ncbi:MAG: ATP-binding protein [Candidatus Omnitrophota bacterium]
MRYIHRLIENKLLAYAKQFPVVVLTGSRQCGKSTLLKHLFKGGSFRYINFDERGMLERALEDPDLFVKDFSSDVIIDEAQKCPQLLHSIKWKVDEGFKCKIILSGSASFQLLYRVTETLAGRAGVLELFPFSINERSPQAGFLDLALSAGNLKTLVGKISANKPVEDKCILRHILWGGYPKIYEYKNNEFKRNWFENYRTTYLERDLRTLTQVADLSDFQRFYQLLAFQQAGILNLSNLSNEIGITVPTCKRYLQILEASYQYFLLRPYHLNLRKRLVKTPKVYLMDTGMGNFFLGNDSLPLLLSSGRFGNILENWFVAEMVKQNSLRSRRANLYFWRTSGGAEVDLLIEDGERIIPVEVKASVRITDHAIRGLSDFLKLRINKRVDYGVVFYRGRQVLRLSTKIIALPINFI